MEEILIELPLNLQEQSSKYELLIKKLEVLTNTFSAPESSSTVPPFPPYFSL